MPQCLYPRSWAPSSRAHEPHDGVPDGTAACILSRNREPLRVAVAPQGHCLVQSGSGFPACAPRRSTLRAERRTARGPCQPPRLRPRYAGVHETATPPGRPGAPKRQTQQFVDQLGITSADQALEIYQTVLPHTAAVDARRRELVSKIVDERVRNRR